MSWKTAAEDTGDAEDQGGYPMSSVLRTTVLLAALTALFLVIGGALGGNQGLVIAFVIALLMNFASYWFSDKIVLSMYGAQMAANPATAHLFIVNPLSGESLLALFSTHPPIEERIRRLRSLSPMRG
jgi:Zn-dependent protease with chaperone function